MEEIKLDSPFQKERLYAAKVIRHNTNITKERLRWVGDYLSVLDVFLFVVFSMKFVLMRERKNHRNCRYFSSMIIQTSSSYP